MTKLSISLVAALSLVTVAGCKKKGGGGDAIAKLEEFSKNMCDCKDKGCADKVQADMTTWGTEMAKTADKDAKPDPDMAKKSADVMNKYTECMTKLMMAGAGGGAMAVGDKQGGDKPAAADKPADGGGDLAAAGITPDAVKVEFTGNYKAGDNPKDEYPVFKVTNNSKKKLFYFKGFQYYYDKDGKQLGREFAERYQISIDPGQTKEIDWGTTKEKQPKGTDKIQAAITGGNFEGKLEWKGDEKALAPDTRPMSK